jgi:putative spermidine/putrescine transport system substrate-binding protein
MRSRRVAAFTTLVLVAALVAGCGDDDSTDSGGTFTPPSLEAASSLPPAEGELNILAWPGYAEDGSTDKSANWVGPFEEETGCKVNVKTFGTSDEAFELFKSGQYDTVSASGDASLRLVAGGYVEPVNTDLVPNYADVIEELKDQPWNTVDGVNYGIPHGRGANILMYNKKVVDPAPTSWSAVFDANSPYKGQVTAYGGPIYIADAALVLMKTQPDLKITNPYALDQTQFDAAVKLLETQRSLISEYWTDAAKQIDAFKGNDPSVVIGTSWQYQANTLGDVVGSTQPTEGSTGWSDTWMVGAKSAHKGCAYRWLDHIVSPEINEQVAEWFGEAPANAKSCDLSETAKANCETFHAEDTAYWENVYLWTTPIEKCLDGRTDVKCVDYSKWQDAFARIKG